MRALKWLVAVMGVLIVVGTVTLVAVIVHRVNASGGNTAFDAAHLGQPPGTRILSVTGIEGRLAILVARPDGERVLIWDPKRGAALGELRAAP